MPHELKGKPDAKGRKFAVVVSRFNEYITARLQKSAVEVLQRHGCAAGDITIVQVPGAFEIPLAAKSLADTGRYDGVICLGCVIRGETPHFEYVAGQAAAGIAQVALSAGVPTSLGVITADTLDQAMARSSEGPGNKGAEAALCAIEMADLLNQMRGSRGSSN